MNQISIAKNFSDVPWGRYPSDGEFCGQNFREKFLLPALENGGTVVVNLDGVEGFGSSFLDEAFAGLVFNGHFSPQELRSRLKVETSEEDSEIFIDLIWRYVNEAASGGVVA